MTIAHLCKELWKDLIPDLLYKLEILVLLKSGYVLRVASPQ